MFVPILVLLLAFLAVTNQDRVKWWKICLSGFLSGGAICGMHYLGNASISNYRCTYTIAYVVGAAIIAVSASTTALAVFFVFESTWKSAWWRRVLCAAVLAGAVSGMHWCAAVGTQYVLIGKTGSGMSRDTTIIIVICLVRCIRTRTLSDAIVFNPPLYRPLPRSSLLVHALSTP